ncbi:hypothetical protein EDB92DRAFT_1794110 [Lactarius akahatsu]|uniref:Endopeptidase S2P n=1 Tax=Lactarius akahatsu TaxID=416441 RepID=A0AAD4LMW4_9AGAM|nr:hypothetical protein EDB92DRAFT_1794110 [Lactarius akahatsu]
MISLALPLLLLSWFFVHFIHRFYIPPKKSRGILPTSLTNRRRNTTTVTLKTVYLRIESTAFNFRHDVLSHWLTRNTAARLPTALRVAFDAGIVISLLGMVVALVLLSWTFMLLARRLVAGLAPPSPDIHTHVKRAYQSDYAPPTSPARSPADLPVQLLIPGITLPLSHLPMLIGALFFSQAIHEAGHAVCAALDGVPLQSLGASLTFVLPAAFVAFPSHTVAALSPHVRARIAAAGPLLSALLGLAFMLPFGRVFLLAGYSDVSAEGLMVASVAPDSPLASHLPLGAFLTALDDFSLAGAKESAWHEYLTTPRPPDFKEPAWCVDTKWFLSHPHGCCTAPPPGPSSDACLVPLTDEETSRCTNASELLVPTTNVVTRCEGPCTNGQMCVRLRGGEEFLRIRVRSDDPKNPTRVILWRGARDEIYQGVDVTRWRPRSPFLPLWFPNLAAEIMQYIQTLTISLFFLNVLPLPQLDGGILLDAVLRHLERKSPGEIDVEVGVRERGAPSRSLRGGFPSRLLRVLTIGLLGGCGLLAACDVILGKYMRSSG